MDQIRPTTSINPVAHNVPGVGERSFSRGGVYCLGMLSRIIIVIIITRGTEEMRCQPRNNKKAWRVWTLMGISNLHRVSGNKK